MAKLRKTKAGSWEIFVYMGRDSRGNQIRETKTFAKKKEAQRWARDKEIEKETGILMEFANMTFKQYILKWLDEFVDEIKVLMDSASIYNDYKDSASTYNDFKNYNELWYKISDLVYAEMKLRIVSLNQILLIASQGNMNTIDRELYNEIISIKLNFVSLRLELALR